MPAGLPAFGSTDPVIALETRISTAAGRHHVDSRRGLRFPIEGHVRDGHRATGSGTAAQ